MKLFKLEWLKFKGHTFFLLGTGLYVLCMVGLIVGIGNIEPLGNRKTGQDGPITLGTFGEMGFYKVPFIWHNITYIAGYFKFIPAFILLFFVANEYKFKTYRQNLIDGLTKSQFYSSKLLSVLFFSLFSTLVIGLTGLIAAIIYNPDMGFSEFFAGSDFLLGYFAEVLFLITFAAFLTFLMRSSTVAIIILLLYYFLIEPFLGFAFMGDYKIFLPTRASRELINEPFSRMTQMDLILGIETAESIPLKELIITFSYTIIFAFGGYIILKKRDA